MWACVQCQKCVCAGEMVSVDPCVMSKDACMYQGDGSDRGLSLIPRPHIKSWLWWGTFVIPALGGEERQILEGRPLAKLTCLPRLVKYPVSNKNKHKNPQGEDLATAQW